jgi:RHS repeat-associated protein
LTHSDTITDEAGSVVLKLSYDAYGKRRNSNWTDATGPIAEPTSRGFTGHEMDDESGLINMNAREYDPVIGRFLSADTVIEAGFGQGLNRYSYVLNNPLSATDPTGHSWWTRFRDGVENAEVAYTKWQVANAIVGAYASAGYVITGGNPLGAVQGAIMAYRSYRAYEQGASWSDLLKYAAKGYATMYLMKSIGDWAGPSPTARMLASGVGGYLQTGDSTGFWRGFAAGAIPNDLGLSDLYKTSPVGNFFLNLASSGVRGGIVGGRDGAEETVLAFIAYSLAGHAVGYFASGFQTPKFRDGAWFYPASWQGFALGNVISGRSELYTDPFNQCTGEDSRPSLEWLNAHELEHIYSQQTLGAYYGLVHALSLGAGFAGRGLGFGDTWFFMEQAPFEPVPYASRP